MRHVTEQQNIQQEAPDALSVPGAPSAHLQGQKVQHILKEEQVHGRGEPAGLGVLPDPPDKQGHHGEEPGHPNGVQGEVGLHLIHFPKEFHGTASFLNLSKSFDIFRVARLYKNVNSILHLWKGAETRRGLQAASCAFGPEMIQ